MDTEFEAPTEVEASDTYEAPIEEAEGFDEGQAGESVEPIDVPVNVLNLDEYSDYVVPVGEDYIPVSEWRDGGLRQADYTRKTQELAEMRRELERASTLDRALQANPQGTLQFLAQQHGLTIAEAAQAVQRQRDDDDYYWDDEATTAADPVEQRLARIEQRFQQEEAEREVTSTFDRLREKYGEDFDPQEVARAATARNIFDPNLLEMVYRDLAFEKITAARTNATTQAQQQAKQQEQLRRKAAAAAAVATGATGGTSSEARAPEPPRNLTVREAAELAWQQLYGD